MIKKKKRKEKKERKKTQQVFLLKHKCYAVKAFAVLFLFLFLFVFCVCFCFLFLFLWLLVLFFVKDLSRVFFFFNLPSEWVCWTKILKMIQDFVTSNFWISDFETSHLQNDFHRSHPITKRTNLYFTYLVTATYSIITWRSSPCLAHAPLQWLVQCYMPPVSYLSYFF